LVGRYKGNSTTTAITKRSSANSGTGTEATIDLPIPTLLPTNNMDAINNRA